MLSTAVACIPWLAGVPADMVGHAQNLPLLYEVEERLLLRTNACRKQHGLHPLRLDKSLQLSARRHAMWMTRNRNLEHTTAAVGENIAMGQRSAKQVIRDWLNSPGHRANLLSAGYTRIGIAAYQTRDGAIYWCQQFLR